MTVTVRVSQTIDGDSDGASSETTDGDSDGASSETTDGDE